MSLLELYQTRSYQKNDESFIYATWLKGLYFGNELIHQVPHKIYYPSYHQVIESILGRKDVRVTCACLKEDPDVILSYCVVEKDCILHWVFTKSGFRKMEIAKSIIPSTIQYVTTLTKLGKIVKPKTWVFNPFLI
jgi:hypothetical protein